MKFQVTGVKVNWRPLPAISEITLTLETAINTDEEDVEFCDLFIGLGLDIQYYQAEIVEGLFKKFIEKGNDYPVVEIVDDDDDAKQYVRIPLKPLSTNDAWSGKRYKTKEYKDFEQILLILLRKMKPVIPEGPVGFDLRVGISARFDADNTIKTLLDTIEKYCNHFNDNSVFDIHVRKVLVPAGDEYMRLGFYEFTGQLDE